LAGQELREVFSYTSFRKQLNHIDQAKISESYPVKEA